MKSKFTISLLLTCLLSLGGVALAQNAPIDFEAGGYGASWTWTVFENDTNPAVEIVANPSASGVNTSATVAMITALQSGQPWAGCESQHGADIGSFSFSEANSTVKVMVYKSVISDVGVKFVESSGEAQPEVKVANTVINEWEELTFDLSGSIGAGITGIIDQIVIFPDFDLGGRTQDNIVYFDNITFSAGGGVEPGDGPEVAAPTPNEDAAGVISIFSDAYTNLEGTDLNPNWGQATVVTQELIDGNNTLVYTGLNYQGTQFTGQDISGMTYVHLDYWTANSTAVNFFVISQNPTVDTDYHTFAIETEQWVSLDIPLAATYPNVDLTDVFQFKFEGNGTIYLDNLYFHSNPLGLDGQGREIPASFSLEQNFPNPFNPSTTIRFSLEQADHVTLKLYNVNGQEVASLIDGQMNSGQHTQLFNANDFAAGTYFYSLTVGNQSIVKKMVLIK